MIVREIVKKVGSCQKRKWILSCICHAFNEFVTIDLYSRFVCRYHSFHMEAVFYSTAVTTQGTKVRLLLERYRVKKTLLAVFSRFLRLHRIVCLLTV